MERFAYAHMIFFTYIPDGITMTKDCEKKKNKYIGQSL